MSSLRVSPNQAPTNSAVAIESIYSLPSPLIKNSSSVSTTQFQASSQRDSPTFNDRSQQFEKAKLSTTLVLEISSPKSTASGLESLNATPIPILEREQANTHDALKSMRQSTPPRRVSLESAPSPAFRPEVKPLLNQFGFPDKPSLRQKLEPIEHRQTMKRTISLTGSNGINGIGSGALGGSLSMTSSRSLSVGATAASSMEGIINGTSCRGIGGSLRRRSMHSATASKAALIEVRKPGVSEDEEEELDKVLSLKDISPEAQNHKHKHWHAPIQVPTPAEYAIIADLERKLLEELKSDPNLAQSRTTTSLNSDSETRETAPLDEKAGGQPQTRLSQLIASAKLKMETLHLMDQQARERAAAESLQHRLKRQQQKNAAADSINESSLLTTAAVKAKISGGDAMCGGCLGRLWSRKKPKVEPEKSLSVYEQTKLNQKQSIAGNKGTKRR